MRERGLGCLVFTLGKREERGERACAVVYLWQGAVDNARGGSLLSIHRVFKGATGPKKEPSSQSTRWCRRDAHRGLLLQRCARFLWPKSFRRSWKIVGKATELSFILPPTNLTLSKEAVRRPSFISRVHQEAHTRDTRKSTPHNLAHPRRIQHTQERRERG